MESRVNQKLTHKDLWSLEDYTIQRDEFRKKIIAHKQNRRLALGESLVLYFEDALTIKYQVQEMLRIEKIFMPEAVREELAAYNPLIPDGDNFKATCMLEYTDIEKRKRKLAELVGIEHHVWVKVADLSPIYAISNEDMARSTTEKTSAVHFMRFELDSAQIEALQKNAALVFGVDHDHCQHQTAATGKVKELLIADITRP